MLLETIPVWIQKKETQSPPAASKTKYFGAPVGQAYYKPERHELQAQVVFGEKSRRAAVAAGVTEHTIGHLAFDVFELADRGLVVEPEDLICQIGDGPGEDRSEYYVVKLRPFGHFGGSGGRYVKAFFTDKTPKYRSSGGGVT